MARYLFRQMLASFLLLLPTMQQGAGALVDAKHLQSELHASNTARHHVYVLASNPSGRAVIGKALTRLGYLPADDASLDLDSRSLLKEGKRATNSGSYSYTDISTPQEILGGISSIPSANSDYIIIQQGNNESSVFSDLQNSLLELNFDATEALGEQAEKWVTLCNFLGLGYSTVERLKLWEFP